MGLTCKDIMLTEQEILCPTDNVSTAFRLMRKQGMRFLPVVKDDGTYLGVFTSPTMIQLLLPRALTIELSGGKRANKSLSSLAFYNLDEETFHESLADVGDELVIDHLSDPANIPIATPETPAMEGILLLHQHKRHVVLLDSVSKKFVGMVTNNSVLRRVFDEDYKI